MASSNRKKKKQQVSAPTMSILLVMAMVAFALLVTAVIMMILRSFSVQERESQPVVSYNAETPTQTEMLLEHAAEETMTETSQPDEPELSPVKIPATTPPGMVTGISLSFYDALMDIGDDPICPVVTIEPADATDLTVNWSTSNESVVWVDEDGRITPVGVGSCTVRGSSASNPFIYAEVFISVQPLQDVVTTPLMSVPASDTTYTETVEVPREDIRVINGITYVQGVMMVNKTYPLPKNFSPGGLIPEAADAFAELQAAASAEAGLKLFSHSDFRSYKTQATVYDNYCATDGQEMADTFSARPGYSEHQTGMVIDVNLPSDSFNDTPEAIWLEENCWRFGFIVRFPRGKEEFTGYKYESWHIRYVGKEWAKLLYDSGMCMEEFFHVTSKYP